MAVQTPLHYIFVWLGQLPADPRVTSFWVRLPSAIAGVLAVPLLYFLGRELFSRRAGLLAAVLLALSPVAVNYSQDLRPYSILSLLTLAAVYALVRAHRTGSARWWAVFAAAAALNCVQAYHAVTLALPAMAPLMAYVLWQTLRQGRERTRGSGGWTSFTRDARVRYTLLSYAYAGAVAILVAIDMTSVPRSGPDLRSLQAASLITVTTELLAWLAQLGMGDPVERSVQLGLMVLALGGAYFLYKRGQSWGLFVCAGMVLIPGPILAVFATTNVVFERYALFTLPFYLLLLSAVVTTWTTRPAGTPGSSAEDSNRRSSPLAREMPSWAASVGLAVVFAIGLYNYAGPNPTVHIAPIDSTRDVSRYLASVAGPQDSILFVGWFGAAPSFYWPASTKMPAVYHSAEDLTPLPSTGAGKTYWVVASGTQYAGKAGANSLWSQVSAVGDTLILRQDQSSDVSKAATTIESYLLGDGGLEAARDAHMMAASAWQSQGEVQKAAAEYRAAGTAFLSTGSEYLRTSREYVRRGDMKNALDAAMQSRAYEPQNPAIHSWLASLLEQQVQFEAANQERTIASILSSTTGALSNPATP